MLLTKIQNVWGNWTLDYFPAFHASSIVRQSPSIVKGVSLIGFPQLGQVISQPRADLVISDHVWQYGQLKARDAIFLKNEFGLKCQAVTRIGPYSNPILSNLYTAPPATPHTICGAEGCSSSKEGMPGSGRQVNISPLPRFHTRSILSPLVETMKRPSGENAHAITYAAWPSSVLNQRPPGEFRYPQHFIPTSGGDKAPIRPERTRSHPSCVPFQKSTALRR